MTQPIFNPQFWERRISDAAPGRLYESVNCENWNKWQLIRRRHTEILSRLVSSDESILDAGCGYGRILELLPRRWSGYYLGIDLSPSFVRIAKLKHPTRDFIVGDLRHLPLSPDEQFDWALLVSIRHMVIRNVGRGVWRDMEVQLRGVAKRLLFLEYDSQDKGSVE